MNIGFADTVIEIATGRVGKVVELDNNERTHCVCWRDGVTTWHYQNELWKI